jgi:uncharacterized RDD family membrane protein YckC
MASGPDPRAAAAYSPPASGASGPRAGFWQRFGALVIDVVIIIVVETILIAALKSAGSVLALIFSIGYVVYFEGGPTGQTVGKRALGIRVISFDTGGPIGYGRAFVRYIGKIISGFFFLLGYLWMLWDGEKQCWHDKMASDVVVPVSVYPVGPEVPRVADPPYPTADPPYPSNPFGTPS